MAEKAGAKDARAEASQDALAAKLQRRFPTFEDLRVEARRRVPRFAFDFVDGGCNEEQCRQRNAAALASVELLPRYCIDPKGLSTEVELFGHRYAAPFGVAPMGSGGLMWPGGEEYIAREAQRRNLPYILATPANTNIERIAEIAPDVFWFQLYRFAANEHAVTFDLLRRADAAGAKVLVPTIDSAGKSKRPRDIRSGATVPFRFEPGVLWQLARCPRWTLALCRTGRQRSANLLPYAVGGKQVRSNGSHTWDELARLRDRWKRTFVVKGVLHPADAERLVSLGVDGLIVSNHGGRHFDGAPAAIDILPAIVSAVGSRTTVLVDSGIRGGLDIVRSLALGAKGTFLGRPFLYGIGALGEPGARQVVDLLMDELRTEFMHVGIRSVAEAQTLVARHPGAWSFVENRVALTGMPGGKAYVGDVAPERAGAQG